jgi:hypothetical protein
MDRLDEINDQIEAGKKVLGGDADNVDSHREVKAVDDVEGATTQLDFLESQGYDETQLENWRQSIEAGTASAETMKSISEAVNTTADTFANLSTEAANVQGMIQTSMNEIALGADNAKERMKMLEEGTINAAAYGQAAIAAINEEKWGDFEAEEVEEYADYLREAADSSELLSDELKENEEAAEDVALYVKKMN